MEEAARVLSARTHYDVLGLAVPTEAVPRAEVRRRYKELAVRLHPDKNRAPGAEEAFKRLRQAYECLADHHTQGEYLTQLRARKQSRPLRHRTHTSTKRSRPNKPPPPPPRPPHDSTTSSACHEKTWRTPEEIWRRFQREEEEQAKREFLQKGFDRDYAKYARKRRRVDGDDTQGGEIFSQPVVPSPSTGTDSSADRTKKTSPSNASDASDPVSQKNVETHSQRCCFLCRRKFPSAISLRRHEELSVLHQENLLKLTHKTS